MLLSLMYLVIWIHDLGHRTLPVGPLNGLRPPPASYQAAQLRCISPDSYCKIREAIA